MKLGLPKIIKTIEANTQKTDVYVFRNRRKLGQFTAKTKLGFK